MVFEVVRALLSIAEELRNIHNDLDLLIRNKIKGGGTSEDN